MAISQTATPAPAIRLIAIDMDGTLLRDDGQISPRNHAALLAAQSAGIEIVIATGRRHCFAMHILRPLGLHPASALISSNGTVTRTLGSSGTDPIPTQLLARTHMPQQTALWLVNHIDEFRDTLVLTFDRTDPNGEDARGSLVVEHFDQLNASIHRWMTLNAPYIAQVNPIEQALADPADSPIQAMLCGTLERMSRAEARLLEHPGVASSGHASEFAPHQLTLHRTEYPARNLSILDILPANCSKGVALLTLAATKNIDPSQILAIGDNWNDVSMLELGGRAVLMANAPEDLKALARTQGWQIGPSNRNDGVAAAIESALHLIRLINLNQTPSKPSSRTKSP